MMVNERKMCVGRAAPKYGHACSDRSDIIFKNSFVNFLLLKDYKKGINFFIHGCNGSPEPVPVCLKLKEA